MCGQEPCQRPLLVAGYFDGTARSFCLLLEGTGKDAVHDTNKHSTRSGGSAVSLPSNAFFVQVATFINPSSQEAVAFVAARPATDGSVVVLLLGSMGGRSMFSTSSPHTYDLQPLHSRQLPQDYFYPTAMLWPDALCRTVLISDCESGCVEEVDALTGKFASQQCLLFCDSLTLCRPSAPQHHRCTRQAVSHRYRVF
jgi:hypothetical protein